MAEKGFPPKGPIMPIGCAAQNRKRHTSSTWTNMEGSMITEAAMAHPFARKIDVDRLESNLGLLNKENLKSTEDLTGLPSSSDHNSSSSEGGVSAKCSSKDEVVEDMKSPCKISLIPDSNMDAKRVKRILANRLSAQRSRVKKMQYVNELEKSVSALQAKIGLLTPQVAYYDNQRQVLSAENSVIKQRIAALIHERLSKDAQFDALRQDRKRLNQLSQFQELQEQLEELMMGFEFDETQNMHMKTEVTDPLNF